MVVEADIDRVRTAGREVKLGVFPMGIDSAEFSNLAADADVLARVEAIRHDAGGRRIVLGIDRLDYTKGIPRRLEALERLLERDAASARWHPLHPDRRSLSRGSGLVQTIPTRSGGTRRPHQRRVRHCSIPYPCTMSMDRCRRVSSSPSIAPPM